ncbi:fungal zn(2)-Cys(6) binuclear cluster domain-containing protein [Sarocladium implicatum]|nr:fungal zn(2)-Cys(6) binuclear cluster domain-containing protein [Sarocladium implicatum]
MVGVAGRSKACHNCRKRRVACGLERPHCLRCQKAGLDCSGYIRHRALFVNRTIANPSTTAHDAISTRTFSTDASQDVVDDYYGMYGAFTSGQYIYKDFRATAFRILRQLYLPRKHVANASLAVGASFWVEAVCNCPQESPTLDHALLALCASQLYITRRGDMTLDQALEIYSNGLSKLAKCLQSVEPSHLPSLLASIVAFATCELFICPLNSGWRAHVQGMAELLRYRVSLHHQDGSISSWMQLCARARVMSVLTGLMTRTQSNVTAAQWRTIMPDRPQDDPFDDLLDIMSELPALLEMPDSSREHVAEILRVIDGIYAWERDFRKRNAAATYSFVPSRLCNSADEGHDEKLYPLVLDFPSLQIAACFIVCWAAMLQTLAKIMRLGNNVDDPHILQPVWAFLDQKMFRHASPKTAVIVEAKRRAGLLCQCIEYTHREELRSLGPQSMVSARCLLLRFFAEQDMSRELAWCRNIPYMTDQRGEKFAVQLLDFRV